MQSVVNQVLVLDWREDSRRGVLAPVVPSSVARLRGYREGLGWGERPNVDQCHSLPPPLLPPSEPVTGHIVTSSLRRQREQAGSSPFSLCSGEPPRHRPFGIGLSLWVGEVGSRGVGGGGPARRWRTEGREETVCSWRGSGEREKTGFSAPSQGASCGPSRPVTPPPPSPSHHRGP